MHPHEECDFRVKHGVFSSITGGLIKSPCDGLIKSSIGGLIKSSIGGLIKSFMFVVVAEGSACVDGHNEPDGQET